MIQLLLPTPIWLLPSMLKYTYSTHLHVHIHICSSAICQPHMHTHLATPLLLSCPNKHTHTHKTWPRHASCSQLDNYPHYKYPLFPVRLWQVICFLFMALCPLLVTSSCVSLFLSLLLCKFGLTFVFIFYFR